MSPTIRPYADRDASPVRALFVAVNRALAPPALRDAFESYIARSLAEEIDCISAYYADRDGGFWVAEDDGQIIGMFGLETVADGAMELRRMYVAAQARRRGLARQMLAYAEAECRRRGWSRLVLSTSELQPAAVALYRAAGFTLEREERAASASNKTIGGGINRFYFSKSL